MIVGREHTGFWEGTWKSKIIDLRTTGTTIGLAITYIFEFAG